MLDLGLQDTVDSVYGASAGAINATYFLSGQTEGLDVYTEHLCSSQFLDFSCLWPTLGAKREPMMKLDYLIDDVMEERVPLDWQAVLSSPIPLKIVAVSGGCRPPGCAEWVVGCRPPGCAEWVLGCRPPGCAEWVLGCRAAGTCRMPMNNIVVRAVSGYGYAGLIVFFVNRTVIVIRDAALRFLLLVMVSK